MSETIEKIPVVQPRDMGKGITRNDEKKQFEVIRPAILSKICRISETSATDQVWSPWIRLDLILAINGSESLLEQLNRLEKLNAKIRVYAKSSYSVNDGERQDLNVPITVQELNAFGFLEVDPETGYVDLSKDLIFGLSDDLRLEVNASADEIIRDRLPDRLDQPFRIVLKQDLKVRVEIAEVEGLDRVQIDKKLSYNDEEITVTVNDRVIACENCGQVYYDGTRINDSLHKNYPFGPNRDDPERLTLLLEEFKDNPEVAKIQQALESGDLYFERNWIMVRTSKQTRVFDPESLSERIKVEEINQELIREIRDTLYKLTSEYGTGPVNR